MAVMKRPPDIFVSYAREDEARVRLLVEALQAAGYTVFWDRRIPAGSSWREYIGTALHQARCIVVVWSTHSIASTFVAEEADEGQGRNALLPLLFDPVLPPLGLRGLHAADLTAWNGDRADPTWLQCLADLSARLSPPSQLGRYRLHRVLGQGAMGVVYEAEDTRLGRTVAVKTVQRGHLLDDATAGDYAARFEREARAAASLTHPNIVTLFDYGEHEDVSYIVMELVRGHELAQTLDTGERLGTAQTVRMMGELLAALDYAHRQGIVHRDVKPANVLIDEAGHVKLADFGVARVTSTGQDRTTPGTLVGTPSYMAPEQILGLAVGSRADIFAAGVILYQCLTGRRPFIGPGAFKVQQQIVQDDPTPPSQLDPSLSVAFDAIVARALAKQPEQRYESAAAFAADLERTVQPAPADADDASPIPPAPDPDATVRVTVPPVPRAPAKIEASTWPTPIDAPVATPVPMSQASPAVPTPAPAAPARLDSTSASAPSRARWLPSARQAALAGIVAAVAVVAWLASEDSPPPSGATLSSAAPPAIDPAPVPAPSAAQRPAARPESMDGATGAGTDRATQGPATEAANTPARAEPATSPESPPPAAAAPVRAAPPPSRTAETPRQPARDPGRCADLLQRMQLGEPLSAGDNTYFQTHCTR